MICIVLGLGFVWWYFAGAGGSSTVKFTPQDLAAMQDAGKQLTYQGNGGNPTVINGMGRPLLIMARPLPPDPDGVFSIGSLTVIRAGPAMVRVQATAAGKPMFVFRQRTWGRLKDAPSFTIARRIVHEKPLATQLAVTDAQLAQLAKIVATPPLKGAYLSALPVEDAEMTTAATAWAAYQTALASKDPKQVEPATSDMLKTMHGIGDVALARANKEYAASDEAIGQVLTPLQITAYHQGKTISAP